jgi:hypothetical protein
VGLLRSNLVLPKQLLPHCTSHHQTHPCGPCFSFGTSLPVIVNDSLRHLTTLYYAPLVQITARAVVTKKACLRSIPRRPSFSYGTLTGLSYSSELQCLLLVSTCSPFVSSAPVLARDVLPPVSGLGLAVVVVPQLPGGQGPPSSFQVSDSVCLPETT